MLTPNEAYQYDGTFRRVVDLMVAYLSEFEITPAELRQAAMLASSMHEDRRIRPLHISKSKSWLYGSMYYPVFYMDEAKNIPPAMFGGICSTDRTASGAITGRISSDGSTVTQLDKYKCICEYTGIVMALHSQTCKDYNWSITHPSRLTEHVFGKLQGAKDYEFRACVRCGLSDVYTKGSTESCKGNSERRVAKRRVNSAISPSGKYNRKADRRKT